MADCRGDEQVIDNCHWYPVSSCSHLLAITCDGNYSQVIFFYIGLIKYLRCFKIALILTNLMPNTESRSHHPVSQFIYLLLLVNGTSVCFLLIMWVTSIYKLIITLNLLKSSYWMPYVANDKVLWIAWVIYILQRWHKYCDSLPLRFFGET